jgi:WhiB family redox-sensing transcriptional regulator
MAMTERFDEADWRESGACRTVPTAVFFPDTDSEAGPAKAICAVCPVREECLSFALANREEQGVWGGLTETERRRTRRRRAEAARAAARRAA